MCAAGDVEGVSLLPLPRPVDVDNADGSAGDARLELEASLAMEPGLVAPWAAGEKVEDVVE